MIQTTTNWAICDVCRILDYNCEKKDCTYCPLCDAWICQEDSNKWTRRLKAAIKRKLEPGFRGDPTYSERLTETGELK